MTRKALVPVAGADAPDLSALRSRLARMILVSGVCVVVAGASIVGAVSGRSPALYLVFAAALLAGFASHVWLIAGLGARRRAKGSV